EDARIEIARELLARGADAAARDRDANTALACACYMSRRRLAGVLLGATRGPDPRALENAAARGWGDVVAALLDAAGGDLPAPAGAAGRASSMAAFGGRYAVCDLLLARGPALDLRDPAIVAHPLCHAAVTGDERLVGYLLDRGAPPSPRPMPAGRFAP